MRRAIVAAAAVLAAGLCGCSSTPKPAQTQFPPATVQPPAPTVTPVGYTPRLSAFDISKDCKT